ncbi:hypothetical protein [Helicobacter labacensis]|nr:hypothetical protein [Helicobacter labacensis]
MRLLESAREEGDEKLIAFLEEVLEVYEKHGINGHVVWKKH